MQETKKRKGESVEVLDAKIAEMQAELEDGHGRPLSWDEVTSTTAEEMAAKEQRRGILPRLIQAAKVKRLEVELRDREREAEGLREGLEGLYGAYQEKEDELRQAKEARDKAQGEWAIRLSAVQGAEGRAERTARELDELREAGR
jgi:chromosome segregation ATPase